MQNEQWISSVAQKANSQEVNKISVVTKAKNYLFFVSVLLVA